jgi:hypothetical protein
VFVVATLASERPAAPFAFRNYELPEEAGPAAAALAACGGSCKHHVWEVSGQWLFSVCCEGMTALGMAFFSYVSLVNIKQHRAGITSVYFQAVSAQPKFGLARQPVDDYTKQVRNLPTNSSAVASSC